MQELGLTLDEINALQVGDTVYLKHDKEYGRSTGETVNVTKIGRTYIELDTRFKIVKATGELTKDYRGYSPELYKSEQAYNELQLKQDFIQKVKDHIAKNLTYNQAKEISKILGL